MWSAIGAIGSYAGGLAAATYTGFMGTGEVMPYDCAYPFKKVDADLTEAAALSQRHFEQCTQLLEDKEWEPMGLVDPENGDMKAMSRPQIGTYHFVKVQFSVLNAEPMACAEVVKSESLEERKRFSPDMCELRRLAAKDSVALLHLAYAVPPPVAGRDMVFLNNSSVDDDDTVHVWGCSVDSDLCPEGHNGNVRGASLWMWRFVAVGPHTLVTYFTTFDPRGWTPPFLVAWLKGRAQGEFLALRAIMSGKDVKSTAVASFESLGLSQDEIKAAQAKYEADKAAASAQ